MRNLKLTIPQPKSSEKQLQDVILQSLGLQGFTVMEVGRTRKGVTCPACEHWFVPTGYQGNTPGCPDLFIAHVLAGNIWIAHELKEKKGDKRAEQVRLVERGVSHFVKTYEESMDVLRRSPLGMYLTERR